jgi:putative DNA primase/helicase
MERPELRAFDFDPVADAKKGRAEYVAAVLTILRAYHVAGRPNRPKPLGSFEAWSELVRGALLWLGCADPVDTMEEIREADPALAQLQAVMSAWREAFPLENVRAADLIKKASEQRESYDSRDFVNVDLREALLAVAGRGGAMTGLALGKWLSANKGRIAGGMRIEHVGERNKAAVWALVSS